MGHNSANNELTGTGTKLELDKLLVIVKQFKKFQLNICKHDKKCGKLKIYVIFFTKCKQLEVDYEIITTSLLSELCA